MQKRYDFDVKNVQKNTKTHENEETRKSTLKCCVRFGDDSLTTSEEYPLGLIEEIPLQHMAKEMNGISGMLDSIQSRISAGGFREVAKSPRNPEDYQEKLVMRENCVGFGDDSDSEPADHIPGAPEEEQGEDQLKEFPFQEMAEEINGMNATLDRMQARLSVDVFEEIAKLASSMEEEMGLEPQDTRWLILHGSKDPSIRALQINSRRLCCQLADLVRCSELGATRLMAMNRQNIRQSNHLRTYRKQYESVHSYHLAHQLEAGKCLMRYRYCLEVYATWREVHQMGRKAQEAYGKIQEITQTRGQFVEFKKQAIKDISETHEASVIASNCLAKKVKELGLALGIFSHCMGKGEPQQCQSGPPVVVKSTHWQGRYTYTLRFANGDLFTIPVVVPMPANTWYGRMQANLCRSKLPKIQDSVKCTQ